MRVRIAVVVGVSVWASVTHPIVALALFAKAIHSSVKQLRESVMNRLHAKVSVGVALLSVPVVGNTPLAQRFGATQGL